LYARSLIRVAAARFCESMSSSAVRLGVMSYQVFARKWRPQNFSDVIGQKHILKALINGLESQRIHHAYLFTGTRGVGKTTLARVLAKALNCEAGITSKPCGKCGSCLGFEKGQFVDLIEVDAASRTKVEETRELLDNVQYLPSAGRFKIYLIDEVHMFSNHSFNALLKTLEEPPEHVKFLLATTDPKKLPITVLSRCLQFNLLKVEQSEISSHLSDLLMREGVKFEQRGVELLAKNALGSVRDALSLLDQSVSHGGGSITESGVVEMLGVINRDTVVNILKSLALNDSKKLILAARELRIVGPDYSYVLAEILSILVRIATVKALGADARSFEDDPDVCMLADLVSQEDCQLFYQIALLGRKDLAISPDTELAFEMVLLRMLSFRLYDNTLTDNAPPADHTSSVEIPEKKKELNNSVVSGDICDEDTVDKTRLPHEIDESSPIQSVSLNSNDEWHKLSGLLEVSGLTRELYRNTVFIGRDDGSLNLYLAPNHGKLAQSNALELLEEKVSLLTGEVLKIHLVNLTGDPKLSLADQTMADEEEAQRIVEQTMQEDPNVMVLMNEFGATLEKVSRGGNEEEQHE
jgi:DNA polymerase-3 subunit gamma/tau